LRREGHLHGDDVEAVEEVFPELAVLDGLGEIAIGGGDDADLGVSGGVFAEAFVFAFLEEAKEFGLNFLGEFTDFVEEEGAAVGGVDLAPLVLDGPGEGPADVAEEFALEEFFGEGGTADGDEGFVGEVAAFVDGFGDDAFSGAAFAEDEEAGGGGGGAEKDIEGSAHFGFLGFEAEWWGAVGSAFLEGGDFRLEVAEFLLHL